MPESLLSLPVLLTSGLASEVIWVLISALSCGIVVLLLAMLYVVRHVLATERALKDQLDQAVANKAMLDLIDQRLGQQHIYSAQEATALRESMAERLGDVRQMVTTQLGDARVRAEEQSARVQKVLHDSLQSGFAQLHHQLGDALLRSSTDLGQRFEALSRVTDERLQIIGGQVDKRLAEGFEKTTATFTDVVKRLALIDEAQKKITALSTEVVGLQQLLSDKRSRGAFGEVQLAALVSNVMPPQSYALQHKLVNDRIADCVLFLPEPSGTICIDAKFPLESYRVMTDTHRAEAERKAAETQFKQDIKKHIRDIAERYILRGVTADGAVMFIPAEAVFAEIQAYHPDLVDFAHASRVWLTSPTTLWAVLNTASAVLKDAATREQVHIIQHHLGALGEDFQRFRVRMDRLATHIQQANKDVDEVGISARKISERFEKIERVELDAPAPSKSELQQTDLAVD